VASGERAVKSGGRPGANGGDAKENHRRVSTWFAGRWRNHQLKRAEKPHSKFSDRKALDGPATRPTVVTAMLKHKNKRLGSRGKKNPYHHAVVGMTVVNTIVKKYFLVKNISFYYFILNF
jgi:hypothetical protein